MDKTYDPKAIESSWYARWEQRGYFQPRGGAAPYCIALPPPNVTGVLHMGHAFQQTLMDILIRRRRMSGGAALWQCGSDHAGIATQMVVERRLESQGRSRLELGRERFIQEVWNWKEQSGNAIARQSRRLGASMDWSRERFTMDEGLSRAVREVFIRLYDEGLIYRGKRLVNWDPVLRTAVSDLEVEAKEEKGKLWHLRYPRADGKGHVVVATTRPETMLGDAAVAINPEDDRHRGLAGLMVELPLTGRKLPVIADDYVDPTFGSGCVKITPAHDFNDYEVGQRHKLPLLNIFTPNAAINDNGPEPYRGLDRYAARRQIEQDLQALGLVEKIEEHDLVVPRGQRSGAAIEPYLTDQWYVKVRPLAEPAVAAVKNGATRFIPERWAKTYFEWMDNINDWCISRQLWWGHRVPAWHDAKGNIYVGESEAQAREKHGLPAGLALTQDPDVLDTWFSSALWPFSTLGWPEQTTELKRFYPTAVLVTGFDIIFFWVARMMMMGLKFMGDVPFREVYITGLVRDAEGRKMAKSKGNVLDPLDLIDGIGLEALVEKQTKDLMRPESAPAIERATRKQFPQGIAAFGTDSLRFTFAQLATQGRDIRFDAGRLQGYRNFCNKLWNAARYALMNAEAHAPTIGDGPETLGLAERWINTRLALTIEQTAQGLADYRFDLASQALYEFAWDEYCDWYVELSKHTLNDAGASVARKRGALQTLLRVLEMLLRLLHPFIPFITEELWQKVAPRLEKQGETIMLQPVPAATELETDPASIAEMDWVKTFVLGVRRIRAERDIAPGKSLPAQTQGGNEQERRWLSQNSGYIRALAKLSSIAPVAEAPADAATALAGDLVILAPLADLIDPRVERGKLKKELAALNSEKQRISGKLANRNFIDRAPPEIVEKERRKLAEIDAAAAKLAEQLKRVQRLIDQ